jgi:hypothetical protein
LLFVGFTLEIYLRCTAYESKKDSGGGGGCVGSKSGPDIYGGEKKSSQTTIFTPEDYV